MRHPQVHWRGNRARAITPLLVAFILLIVAFAWDSGPGTASATPSSRPVVQAGGSCPLTSAQVVNSVKTFARMMPVFRHPRCSNCHGGIPRPLPNNGEPSINHVGIVDMDSTDNNRTCEECHVAEWGSPGAPDWSGSDVRLCQGLHRRFQGDAPKFLGHILNDNGDPPGFVDLGFKGERGLIDGGKTIYESETGRRLVAAKPPGTHAQFMQLARDWVAAQGGQFVGDAACGCVVDSVEIRFHSAVTIVTPRVTSTVTGDGRLVVKLGPESSAPAWDVAMGARGDTLRINWSGVSISQPAGCDGKVVIKSSPATQFKIWFGMSSSPDLKLSLQVIPGTDLHQVVNRCLLPNGTWIELQKNDPISLFAGAWNALHGKSAEAVMLKATAAMDVTKIDPKALEAMAEAMKTNPNPAAAAAQMTALINQMMPGASQLAAEARNNYTFAIPDRSGCSLGTGTAFLARCDFDRTITVPAGAGPPQTITEKTTITFGQPATRNP